MLRYIFNQPLTIKNGKDADPQVIGEALERIAEKNGGKLTPHDTVKEAASRSHPLHKFFEWKDAVAAEAYRLEQARTLIRCVQLVDDKDKTKTARPAFLSIAERGGTAYRTLSEVQRSESLQSLVLQQAERDLLAWETRYRELADICAIVAQAREALAEKYRSKSRGKSSGDEARPSA